MQRPPAAALAFVASSRGTAFDFCETCRHNFAEMSDQWPAAEQEQIEGTILRVRYQSPASAYVVIEVETNRGLRTCVGEMVAAIPGERVRLFGRWEVHARFGRQFRFDHYQVVREATPEAVGQYLADAIPGIGPELARRIVEHFGERTLAALDEGEPRLREVPGIGPKKATAIAAAWRQHRHVHELMIALRQYGINPRLAGRIYEAYGPQALEIVERQPYRLAKEIHGVGFLTADRIARRAGLPADDPQRIEAAIVHVLDEAAGEGHLYLPRERLVKRAAELTGVPADAADQRLSQMAAEGEVVIEPAADGQAVYRPRAMNCEQQVAKLLLALAGEAQPPLEPDEAEGLIRSFEAYHSLELNDEQRRAVLASVRHGVSVITGGPGTGKTTVTRAIVWLWERAGGQVALCAPTGRAAKRAEELTGHEAQTIHRLLGYRPDTGFVHGPDEPLEHDVVIVDEASMVDMYLALALLRAIAPGTHVVLVGDADQLPPVGPGQFFADVVDSGVIQTTRLTKIYRQAERSLIVTNAHRILAGQPLVLPTPENWRGQDMLWVDAERDARREAGGEVDSEAVQRVALRKISNAVTKNLPRLGFKPADVQVISPMHRGLLGVDNLNRHLQALINPPGPLKPETRRGQTVFRLGDRVLQTANNYDKGVFNGEIGEVVAVDSDGRLVVEFAVGRVDYEPGELDQLELAYALTVHKSQGSEYPAVVAVVHSSHYVMLRRNLLYTALTRAERMAILVGDRKGLWQALRVGGGRERYTRLAARLRGDLPIDGAVGEEAIQFLSPE